MKTHEEISAASSVQPIKPAELKREGGKVREFVPRSVLERSSRLREGLPEHLVDSETREPKSLFARDVMGYTDLMSGGLSGDTTRMLDDLASETASLFQEMGAVEIQKAGDEVLLEADLDPVSAMYFSLQLEHRFLKVMDGYPKIKNRIQTVKGVNPAYIHVAEVKPIGNGSDHAVLRRVELGGIEDLMVWGKALLVKEIAKQFIAQSDRGDIILAGPTESEHLRLLANAGLTVQVVPASGSIPAFYSIEAPHGPKDIEDALRFLERHHPLRPVRKPGSNSSGSVDKEISEINQRMTPFHLREGDETSWKQGQRLGKDITRVGEVAFYAVDGLGALEAKLAEEGGRLFQGETVDEYQLALMRTELLIESGAFTAESLGALLRKGGIDVKETECNWKGVLKAIGVNNVFRENSVNPGILNPNVFRSVQQSVGFLETSQFQEELIEHLVTRFPLLAEAHGKHVRLNPDAVVQAVGNTEFITRVGFASCEYGDLSVVLTDDEDIRGNLITAGGRFMSHLSTFGRRIGETREALQQRVLGAVNTTTDQETLQLLGDVATGSCVIVQREVAERFGLEDGIPISVHSKGFPRPFDLVVLKSRKGRG